MNAMSAAPRAEPYAFANGTEAFERLLNASSGGGGASAAVPHRKPEPSLTIAEAAAILGVPLNTLYNGTRGFHADALARRS